MKASDGDAADAARYRWLREQGKPSVEYLALAKPETWDAAIDAAVKGGTQE